MLEDLCCLLNRRLQTIFTQIVVVSGTKTIVKTRPDISTDDLKQALAGFNQASCSKILKLIRFDGRFLWQELSQRRGQNTDGAISTCIEMSLQGASKKQYKDLLSMLLRSVQDDMRNHGFDFAPSSIIEQWTSMKKRCAGPVTLTFPCVATARGFFISTRTQ